MTPHDPTAHPFIYRPAIGPPGATRTLQGALTLLAWLLYAYLWVPVLTLMGWFLGLRSGYVELYLRENRVDDRVFVLIAILAVAAISLLIGWAEYNRRRFRDGDRRKARRHVDVNDVADSLFAPSDVAHRLRRAKSATLTMDADARLIGIRADTPMPGQL